MTDYIRCKRCRENRHATIADILMVLMLLAFGCFLSQFSIVRACEKHGFFEFGILTFDCRMQYNKPAEPQPDKGGK